MSLTEHDQVTDLPKIHIVGVGGAGNNVVVRLTEDSMMRGMHLAINTDTQELSRTNVPHQIRIGERLTHGLSAGGNPLLGAKADSWQILNCF